MTCTPDMLAEQALEHLLRLQKPRKLVALAGPPGAGKSTVTALLAEKLRDSGRKAAVVPMDGFHLDNAVLEARGLLARKGAPETFDARGFLHLVSRVADGEPNLAYPVFDRHRDISVAGAAILAEDTEFVLFEGNYLLLRDAPWDQLARHWDFAIWVDAPLPQLEARLIERWLAEGLPESEARAKVDGNDLPNAAFVRDRSARGDLVLTVED